MIQKDKRAVGVGITRYLRHAAPNGLVGFAALRVDVGNGRQNTFHAEDDEVAVGDECGILLVVPRL